MDFSLTEEQAMLKAQARSFLEKECPKSLVRQMEGDEKGYSPELWSKTADLGWLGLPFAEEYGGSGGGFLELAILTEELGWSLFPGPFISTVILGGFSILFAGSEAQKKEFIPRIADGSLLLTMALMEPGAGYDIKSVGSRAKPRGDGFVINGTKLFVPDAGVADYILCPALTGARASEAGVTLFLLDRRNPGVRLTRLNTMAGDRQYEIVLDGAPVAVSDIIGRIGEGWETVCRVRDYAAVAQCALMVGGAQRVLEMTLDYAKQRVQFGRPIGGFQAIQHKCVDLATWVEGMRFVTYQAAWRLAGGLPSAREVAVAKAFVGKTYPKVCAEGVHIHGAVGWTSDHDIGLYYRRAKGGEFLFGDVPFYQEIVAQEMGL